MSGSNIKKKISKQDKKLDFKDQLSNNFIEIDFSEYEALLSENKRVLILCYNHELKIKL